MKALIYQPYPGLETIIDNILIISFDFLSQKIVLPVYKFVPTHARSWVFYLEDKVLVKKENGQYSKTARSLFVGPLTKPIMIDYGKKHKSVIVNFKPAGMYRLLGIPLNEMVNSELEASLVFGKEVDDLMDCLRQSKTDDLKNEIIQKYLLKKTKTFKTILPFDLAIQDLLINNGNQTMEYAASKACLSLRQFERISKERLGVSPKFYTRMARFSSAYKHKERFPKTPWIKIAYQYSYFDQMHLIHEFKFFAHANPSQLNEEGIKSSVRFRTLEEPFL